MKNNRNEIQLKKFNIVYVNQSNIDFFKNALLFNLRSEKPYSEIPFTVFENKIPGDILLKTQDLFTNFKDDNSINVVIQSYSELVFLRFMKLVRKGDLSNDDIQFLYIEDISNPFILVLRLDEDGDCFDPWPHGFFEESFEELFP